MREPENATSARDFTAAVDRTVVARLAAGQPQAALELAVRGLAVSESLSALDAENHLGRYDLVASMSQVASAAVAAGDLRLAESTFSRAIALGRDLVRREPGNVIYRMSLAEVLFGNADVAMRRGRPAEARVLLGAVQEELSRVLAAAPDQPAALQRMTAVRERLAVLR